MYKKFNITGFKPANLFEQREIDYLKGIGSQNLDDYKARVTQAIEDYIRPDGYLDASHLQGDWFPEINADVFLSHSHGDKDKALVLSGYLKVNFGLNVFIDSTVWGNIKSLQKKLDNKYCLTTDGRHYDYDEHNQTTAYVHLLLSSALTKMIDNCEVLFFLNSPLSTIQMKGTEFFNPVNGLKTESAWIYHEIFISGLIAPKTPKRIKTKLFSAKDGGRLQESLKMAFPIPQIKDFIKLSPAEFNEWDDKYDIADSSNHPLDTLYSIL